MEYAGYVYCYFRWKGVGRDLQYVYLALSRDGLHFKPLNGNEPILRSHMGTGAVRDPHLLRSRVDGKFYIIATDLDVTSNRWGKFKREGSKQMAVWQSDNLIHWSDQRMPQVADETLGCLWAPKVCYDEKQNDYVVAYSSAQLPGTAMSVCYSRTKDFEHFSKPEVLVSKRPNTDRRRWAWYWPMPKELSFIDSTTVQVDDTFYRFTKYDDLRCVMLEKSQSIVDGYSLVTEAVAGERGVEGPCLYPLYDRDQYVLLLDGYSGPNSGTGYFPLVASKNDLAEGKFRRLSRDEYSLPEGCKHGSVMLVTDEEYRRLEEQIGYDWRMNA